MYHYTGYFVGHVREFVLDCADYSRSVNAVASEGLEKTAPSREVVSSWEGAVAFPVRSWFSAPR
jgi:hypothetical protein